MLDGRHGWHACHICDVYASAASAVATTNAVAGATKPTRVRSPALVDAEHVAYLAVANAPVTEQSPDDASYSQFVFAAQFVASPLSAVHAKNCVVKACEIESVAVSTGKIPLARASHSVSPAFHVQSPVHAALDVIAAQLSVTGKKSQKPVTESPELVDAGHVAYLLNVNSVVTEQSFDDVSYSQFASAAQFVASLIPVHTEICVFQACEIESVAVNTAEMPLEDTSHAVSPVFHVQSPVHAALDVIATHIMVRGM